jgi:hypothetical protein
MKVSRAFNPDFEPAGSYVPAGRVSVEFLVRCEGSNRMVLEVHSTVVGAQRLKEEWLNRYQDGHVTIDVMYRFNGRSTSVLADLMPMDFDIAGTQRSQF